MIVTPEINWLAIFPELILALAAATVLLVEVQWKPAPRVLGWIAGVGLFLAAGVTVVQWFEAMDLIAAGMQGELVAFSGMIVMDGLAVFARMALLVVTALGLAAGWRLIQGLGRRGAEATALILLATSGFSIMVASNNLILMFLGLEVGSIALYVLAGMTTERTGADEAAMKYFLLGSFASAIFVYGVALLYAGTGHFEVTAISDFFSSVIVITPAVIYIGAALMMVGLGFKISAAPFHSWAPDVYQGAPAGFVGYMAATAKVAGFAAMGRIFLAGLGDFQSIWVPLMGGMAVLSMVLGALLALVQNDVRRMLAYSGVAHAGFILTGIVGGAFTAVVFYVSTYVVQLVAAFAVVAVVTGSQGSASPIEMFRGLARRSPVLAGSLTVLLLAMAGLPLTSGFVGKIGVFTDAWAAGQQWLVIVAVLAAVIAVGFYLRLVVAMYLEGEGEGEPIEIPVRIRLILAISVAVTLFWGVLPGSLLDLASNALALGGH